MPMSIEETQRKLDELTAGFINSAIIDLVHGLQEKNWLFVDKAISRLYVIRDNLRDQS